MQYVSGTIPSAPRTTSRKSESGFQASHRAHFFWPSFLVLLGIGLYCAFKHALHLGLWPDFCLGASANSLHGLSTLHPKHTRLLAVSSGRGRCRGCAAFHAAFEHGLHRDMRREPPLPLMPNSPHGLNWPHARQDRPGDSVMRCGYQLPMRPVGRVLGVRSSSPRFDSLCAWNTDSTHALTKSP